jgi:GPH family glycoside/pentoside/hexuronide:cation symporter
MAQKFGGAIGGAAVLWLLDGFGYITDPQLLAAGVVQPDGALSCLRWLMSFIPALVALVSMCIVWFYPLTTERIMQINKELKELRSYYLNADEND